MAKVYNVSAGRVNYSQRNNKVNPTRSCNTTSMTMAASYQPAIWKAFKESEIYKEYSVKYNQPEDCLQQYMLDNGMQPTFHPDLSKAFNRFVGLNVTSFTMEASLETLIREIKEGRPVVISGDFPKSDGRTLGHIVVLVGLVFENEDDKLPVKWIIDDPYGNTLQDWTGSGNDIELTHEYFMKVIKNKNQPKKWAHTFKKLPG